MDKLYDFDKRPENVRQIGELGEKERIYFEDYVVTYMDRLFRRDTEKAIAVYVGTEGRGECAGSYFIYGAIEVSFDIMDQEQGLSAEKWDEVHEDMKQYFPGSQILGWGVGIHMETSLIKKRLKEIQKKYFAGQHQICFVSDQSEETKTLYHFDGLQLRKNRGYMVYYGKNPEMQNYMLRGKQKDSMEASYKDTVVANVRAAVKKNEEKQTGKKTAAAAAAVFFALIVIAGGMVLLQSNRKLERLEETLAVVSKEDEPEADSEKGTSKSPTPNPAGKTTGLPIAMPQGNTMDQPAKPSLEKPSPAKPSPEKPSPEKEAAGSEKPAADQEEEKKADQRAEEKAEKKAEKKAEGTTEADKSPKQEKKEKSGSTKQTKKQQAVPTKKPGKKNESKPASVIQNSYVVQPGDTLSQIVWRQYRDLSKLPLVKERNHIDDENQIQAGQRIILPVY